MGERHELVEEAAIGPVKLQIVPEGDPCGVVIPEAAGSGGPWVAYVDVDGDGVFETPGPTLYWGGGYSSRGGVILEGDSAIAKRGSIATLFGGYVSAQRLGPDCPDVAFRVVRLTTQRDHWAGDLARQDFARPSARGEL
jgi:hypothetical protein